MGVAGTAGIPPDLAVTTAEAAKVAGVTARTIRRWIEKGTLPAVTGAGGVLYVFPRDIEAARIASGSRPSPVRRDVRDATGTGDGPGDWDTSGASPLSRDLASEAAGAVLTAWRDTVLAPVVGELSAVRRELGDARERVGRLEAERDQAARERDELRAEVERLKSGDGPRAQLEAPGATNQPAPTATPSSWWGRWWRRLSEGP